MFPGVFLLLLGTSFLGIAVYNLYNIFKLQKKGIRSKGKIVEIRTDEDGDKWPVIEFKTLENKIIREKSSSHVSTDFDKFSSSTEKIGMQVLVVYDPDEPENFVVAGDVEFSMGVMALFVMIGLGGIIGGICTLLGVSIL